MAEVVADERIDWSSMDHEEAIRRIMRDLRVDRVRAEFILAQELGEVEGDTSLGTDK